ncbi:MAG: LapA family protein [Rickettsiales bacterium]|nr:LapA family protein [Rickettsiales bacterium]
MGKIINILKLALLFLIIMFIIFFSIINSEIVKINVNFFPFHSIIEIRIFLLIIFCFSLGFLCGILASTYSLILKHIENFKEKRKIKKLQKVLERTKEEITNE